MPLRRWGGEGVRGEEGREHIRGKIHLVCVWRRTRGSVSTVWGFVRLFSPEFMFLVGDFLRSLHSVFVYRQLGMSLRVKKRREIMRQRQGATEGVGDG